MSVRSVAGASIVVTSLVLSGCGSDDSGEFSPAFGIQTAFEEAKETCAAASEFVQVLDSGSGLSLEGEGDERTGATIDDILCVLGELEMPDTVMSQINNTRALDGTLTATWGDIDATWSYHPHDGLSMVLATE